MVSPPTFLDDGDVDGVVEADPVVAVVLVEGEVVVEDRSGTVVVVSDVDGVEEVEVGTVEGTVVVGLPPPQKNVHDPPELEPPTEFDRGCPVPSSIRVIAKVARTKTATTVAARTGQLTPKICLARRGRLVEVARVRAAPALGERPGVLPST